MKTILSRVLCVLLMGTLFLSGCAANGGTKPSQNSLSSESSNPTGAAAEKNVVNGSTSGTSNTEKKGLGKVLIVYYSLTGSTREIAGNIKDMTGGDIFEIQPEEDYHRPDVEEIGKKQVKEGYKPKLKNSVANIESYDTIFVGSPVWWFSVSPPVMSFLSQYDLKGKKIVPFCTCVSNYGDFFKQFEKAAEGAKVLNGRDFKSPEFKEKDKVKTKIETWLKEIEKGK
ncbi:MAG: hypothetical protein N2484_18450 [Clostridia bacterium]|nr:hypothetical protein [Clostridia bacterium]